MPLSEFEIFFAMLTYSEKIQFIKDMWMLKLIEKNVDEEIDMYYKILRNYY